ncbi:GNAT family N-acetyltransferase [Arthrobacter sp. lap29]|uniref:GNAT family N-acetyltransferase n=1 Tax=Arthrobacter sp. lap29 TaxID=3056122 RepID=UPI0028F704CC|nr:GNAT family N-acetyltransferase [Arthrobacter sp. lap29]
MRLLWHTYLMIQRATIDDVNTLVALRAAMFEAMGHEGHSEAAWSYEASKWFAEHLNVDACAYIVYVADTAVAAALGYVHTAPPSPSSSAAVTGHLSNVITLEGHRRQGHARACVEALVRWFRDETAVARVDLAASEDGLALYESLGWTRREQPTLRLPISRV